MKIIIGMSALIGLVLISTSAFAEKKYGPVITIKPKGLQAEQAQSKPKPGPAKKVKSGQKPKPTGLILPAVQNAREAGAAKNGNKGKKDTSKGNGGTAINGGLDRDIIRRVHTPKKPKPKP